MPDASTGRIRILILDDDPDLVAVMQHYLEEHGDYLVETALSRTVEEVEASAPDLLIIDAQPGAKGSTLNFVQRLRLGSKLPRLPVLITTSSMRNVDANASRHARVHVLVKPYDGDSLLSSVAALLRPTGRHTPVP